MVMKRRDAGGTGRESDLLCCRHSGAPQTTAGRGSPPRGTESRKRIRPCGRALGQVPNEKSPTMDTTHQKKEGGKGDAGLGRERTMEGYARFPPPTPPHALREHVDHVDAAVDAVADGHVDDAVGRAQRDRGGRTLPSKRVVTRRAERGREYHQSVIRVIIQSSP